MGKIIHREAIESFPFDRMSRTMEIVGWKWFLGRTPTGPEIQLEASQLFRELQKHNSQKISSGGVVVFKNGDVGFETIGGKSDECFEAWKRAGA